MNSNSSTSVFTCNNWVPIQQSAWFQLGNVWFFLAYASPNGKYGLLFLHSSLIAGYFMYSAWAWNVICAPTLFAWTLILVLLNTGQVLYITYQLQPAKFSKYLEDVYETLFLPILVDRTIFSKLVSDNCAHFVSLHAGDAYAVENLSRTDRLALLMNGRVNVIKDNQLLHTIHPCEFLDSPEFTSTSLVKEKKRFEVSLIAECECYILVWQRESIEYLMIKNHYVRRIMQGLIATDICEKLKSLQFQSVEVDTQEPIDMRITLYEHRSDKINTGQPENVAKGDDDNHLKVPSMQKRKSPISIPCDGNIELAGWYQAFLKQELIGYKQIKVSGLKNT